MHHRKGLQNSPSGESPPYLRRNHLHYQLDKGRKNIDPVDYHGTYRRRLSDAVIGDFLREIAPAMGLLDGADSMADR